MKHRFKYLLPGNLLADPTVGHFGSYRLVNGRNSYISVKQLLLADKKICCL